MITGGVTVNCTVPSYLNTLKICLYNPTLYNSASINVKTQVVLLECGILIHMSVCISPSEAC